MAQVLSKEYTCYNCKKPILISKIDNPAPGSKKKWQQWELDSVTPHKCSSSKLTNNNQEHEEEQGLREQREQIAALTEQVATLTSEVRSLKVYVEALAGGVEEITMRRCESCGRKQYDSVGTDRFKHGLLVCTKCHEHIIQTELYWIYTAPDQKTTPTAETSSKWKMFIW